MVICIDNVRVLSSFGQRPISRTRSTRVQQNGAFDRRRGEPPMNERTDETWQTAKSKPSLSEDNNELRLFGNRYSTIDDVDMTATESAAAVKQVAAAAAIVGSGLRVCL